MIEPKVDPKRNGQKEKNKFVAVKEHYVPFLLIYNYYTLKATLAV